MIDVKTNSFDKNKENKKSFFTSIVFVTFGAIVSCFLWGSAYPMIKIGYKEFAISSEMMSSQILFAGIRFMLAGILAILFKVSIMLKMKSMDSMWEQRQIVKISLKLMLILRLRV